MNLRFSRVVLALIAALLLLPLSGCEDKYTQDNYDLIKDGMQLHEVEKIMGGKGDPQEYKGTDISSGGIASGSRAPSQQIYQWQHANKIVTVTVVDGKVIGHNKSGF
jgi:hypothetical protein